jgi:hypothetical protein
MNRREAAAGAPDRSSARLDGVVSEPTVVEVLQV